MRAGRPRSQGNHSPLEGESQKPSRQAKADAVGGGRRVTSSVSRRVNTNPESRPVPFGKLPFAREPGAGSTQAPHDLVARTTAEINKMLNASIKSLSTGH